MCLSFNSWILGSSPIRAITMFSRMRPALNGFPHWKRILFWLIWYLSSLIFFIVKLVPYFSIFIMYIQCNVRSRQITTATLVKFNTTVQIITDSLQITCFDFLMYSEYIGIPMEVTVLRDLILFEWKTNTNWRHRVARVYQVKLYCNNINYDLNTACIAYNIEVICITSHWELKIEKDIKGVDILFTMCHQIISFRPICIWTHN